MNNHQKIDHLLKNEINLMHFFFKFWQKKILVLSIVLFSIILFFGFSLLLDEKYKSNVILVANEAESSVAPSFGQLSSLAGIAGINLGESSISKKDLGITVLKSKDFLSDFLVNYDYMVPIMATKSWNRTENVLIIDEKIFDSDKEMWVRKTKDSIKQKPSIREVHEQFLDMIEVVEDDQNGIITLSVIHQSPYIARDLANDLIFALNEDIRQQNVKESSTSITYLNEQLAKASYEEVRNIISELITKEISKISLAKANEEYVFKVIDSPSLPEIKHEPIRLLYIILGAITGILASIVYVVVTSFKDNS